MSGHARQNTGIFRTTREQTLDKSPTIIGSSLLELMIIDAWCGDSAQLLDVFVSEVRRIIRRIASHVLPYHRTRR